MIEKFNKNFQNNLLGKYEYNKIICNTICDFEKQVVVTIMVYYNTTGYSEIS